MPSRVSTDADGEAIKIPTECADLAASAAEKAVGKLGEPCATFGFLDPDQPACESSACFANSPSSNA